MTKLRNAFTLVELVISIFLLGLIVNFLYSAISNLQKSNKIFNEEINKVAIDSLNESDLVLYFIDSSREG